MMPLWRCSPLYEATKLATHARAASMEAKGPCGNDGQYFTVRKRASEKGLSSDTRGRLKDWATPSAWRVASSVAPFMAPPLSEWRVHATGKPAAWTMRRMGAAANSEFSSPWTSQPTMRRQDVDDEVQTTRYS